MEHCEDCQGIGRIYAVSGACSDDWECPACDGTGEVNADAARALDEDADRLADY